MKKISPLYFLMLAAIYSFSVKEKSKGPCRPDYLLSSITKEQREYAISELQRTKSLLEKELKGLREQQLKFKAAPETWSIADITEHIALAENGIFQIVEGNLKAPADSTKRKEITVTPEDIKRRLINRTTKVQSPDVIKPTGKFPSAAAAYQVFAQRREKTIEYVSNTTDDLLNHFWQHPATGTIDLYQAILLIAAHSERHILQIAEVKASKGFLLN